MTREEFVALRRGSVIKWSEIIGLVFRTKHDHVWVIWEGLTIDIYSSEDVNDPLFQTFGVLAS